METQKDDLIINVISKNETKQIENGRDNLALNTSDELVSESQTKTYDKPSQALNGFAGEPEDAPYIQNNHSLNNKTVENGTKSGKVY